MVKILAHLFFFGFFRFSNVSHDFHQALHLDISYHVLKASKSPEKVNAHYASKASGYLDELSNTLPELVVCTNLQVRRGIGSAGKSRMEQSRENLFVRNMQKPGNQCDQLRDDRLTSAEKYLPTLFGI